MTAVTPVLLAVTAAANVVTLACVVSVAVSVHRSRRAIEATRAAAETELVDPVVLAEAVDRLARMSSVGMDVFNSGASLEVQMQMESWLAEHRAKFVRSVTEGRTATGIHRPRGGAR